MFYHNQSEKLSMQDYKHQFIHVTINAKTLKFRHFTLKLTTKHHRYISYAFNKKKPWVHVKVVH